MAFLASFVLAAGALTTPSQAPRLHPHHHHKRHHHRRPPMQSALASWYDDSGTTASGAHYQYGYAALIFGSRWGHRVRFCYRHRCVTGQLDDHGPYVGGRTFDLSARLRAALGCSDLCYLRWRDQ